jgi:hypothetical protein
MNENLIYKTIFSLIQKDCFGCIHNCPSQKDHNCLVVSTSTKQYYNKLALDILLKEGKIDILYYNSNYSKNIFIEEIEQEFSEEFYSEYYN